MHRRSLLAAFALLAAGLAPAAAQDPATLRIGYQRSSTLIALLREDRTLEAALKPLNVEVSWHEFTSGLPIMEALNVGRIDVSADVADTVPVFAQGANARITFFAQEAASPTAQAILGNVLSSVERLLRRTRPSGTPWGVTARQGALRLTDEQGAELDRRVGAVLDEFEAAEAPSGPDAPPTREYFWIRGTRDD